MPQTAKTATMKKLLLLLAALFAISAGGICCSGSGDDPGEQEKPVDPPPSPDDGVDWSKIDPKATVRGVVTCAGAAVQGVVVTDGVNMTRTNKQGAYGLRTSSDKSKLVYLTVPSGYEVESTRGFIPRFYRRVTAPTSVEQVQQHDFTLKKVNNDRHIMIVSADMHIRNRAMIKTTSSATPSICPPKGELDSTTFRRTYLKALRDYVKALPSGVPVYGMNLGDMTQESHWTNANKATLANFVNVCERGGMPIQTFHAIGNHDHDMAVQNIAGDDDSAAELAYISALGPTYYAVNIGKVHYVVFDNTQYVNTGGDRSFAVRLNRRQMDWAQKDADYMPSDVERIVIAWHCPAFRRNPGASSPNPMDNADELLDIYKDKQLPVTIWSGHNHIAETVTVPRSDMSVTEYTHPCVCGAWWYFPLCHDGAPATFTRYDFSGGTITERRSVNFSDSDEQYCRVYNSGLKNAEGRPVVRLNVWDWHPTWKFECRENGAAVPASQLKAVREYDDYYVTVHDACGNDISSFSFLDKYRTDHMLEYTPVTPSAEIRITATDEYGRQLFTVTTKAGNYFYILIDRANEDKETAVHFLNQVDEADLMALMEDGQSAEKPPVVCNCTEKCEAGKVNTGCPVCKNDLNGCKGKEKPAETEKPAEPEKPKKETGSVGTILFILAALLAVGGIGYYVKIVRPKQQAEDDAEFEDDGYGEGFDPDEAYGEPEYLSEDDFDDKDSK